MYVSMRVSGTTLDELQTLGDAALADFFGTTTFTSNMGYIQAATGEYVDGKPARFEADIQASTT